MSRKLSRRDAIIVTAAAAAGGIALGATRAFAEAMSTTAAPVSDLVRTIHAQTLVIDPHPDIPFDYGTGAHDPKLNGDTKFDIPKARRGGIGAVAIALFVPQGPLTPAGYAAAAAQMRTKLEALRAIAANNPDQVEIALTPDDVLRIHKSGKLAEIISFLNAYPLGEDLSRIDWLYDRGMRIFGFVHAGNNAFADSSRPSSSQAETWHGLSPLGQAAVRRLNDLGVLMDISQLSKKAALQTIAMSRAPVIATHSGVRGLVNNPRNLSDEELAALVAKGGVIAINAFKPYLKAIPRSQLASIKALRAQNNLPETYAYAQEGANLLDPERAEIFTDAISALIPTATIADLVDSIDWAVRRIGIDHVAISSDFNHGGGVSGWEDEGQAINVTAELVKRGYSAADVGKLWGGNVLNVWRAAQAAAIPATTG